MEQRTENKKRRVLLPVLIALLLLSISVSVVWAAINSMKTEDVVNTFTPAETSIKVNESFDGTTKSNVHITNTGSATDPKEGPAVYVRVRLLAYWYDELQDRVVGKASWTPSFTVGADWFLKGDYYYYKIPINAGDSTTNLIDSITLETDDDGARQVLEVIAEAIQSKPSTAVNEAWGVSVGSDGNIVQPQQ